MSPVTFIDTSVLCELLEVPGKSQRPAEVRAELDTRLGRGERFVIPVTAVIETGNHIAHASAGRFEAAQRLCGLIASVVGGDRSFLLREFAWDAAFLQALCAGDTTGQGYEQWSAAGQVGAGDLAILVERDRFVAGSALARGDVRIWTLEAVMGAYA